MRALPDTDSDEVHGSAVFLSALPGTGHSTLARDGVVLFAALHRLLQAGAGSLGNAQVKEAGRGALGTQAALWKPNTEAQGEAVASPPSFLRPLQAGIYQNGEQLVALNQSERENQLRYLHPDQVAPLFQGLDFRILTTNVQDGGELASEVWSTFLLLMAALLVLEALLSLPALGEDLSLLKKKGGKA